MPLDPQVQSYLAQMAGLASPSVASLTPQSARALMEAETRSLGEPPQVGRVENRTIPGPAGEIRIRVTTPEGDGPFPALVYFHGGGWVVGSIATHDALCRAITNAAGVAVVSIDYRLAPEDPFPAAVEDAYAATEWVASRGETIGVDPSRIAVGGDSAGGNLAAVVALLARDRGGPRLAFQVLIYPITNDDLDSPSYREFAEGYLLTREAMAWYWEQYVPGSTNHRRCDPAASPLRAEDLSGLPPALVITAGYDVLRDEAEVYAARMTEAGVAVRLSRHDGMIHGFLRRGAIFDQARKALAEIAEALRTALDSRESPINRIISP
jgi:acetyl esterase